MTLQNMLCRVLYMALIAGLTACATESHQAIEPEQPVSAGTNYQGDRQALVVGKFDNRSTYLRGMFSDGREARISGEAQTLHGAKYALTGDVVEFGRKETGDKQLFGILGSSKTQVAYSKVTINVIDVKTSQVVHSVQGGGEYSLSNREVVGFGGSAGYDSTLNGKVLDLSIREAVDRLVEGMEKGSWAALLGGCATPTRYDWGSYEDLIYASYMKPGAMGPDAQANVLEEERLALGATNQQLPPGWHAQLGYLYFRAGRIDLAEKELLAEKSAYPESARFVDRLLQNLSAPTPVPAQ
jgi:curli biogenesis system outer membrane secretion channel CsgG